SGPTSHCARPFGRSVPGATRRGTITASWTTAPCRDGRTIRINRPFGRNAGAGWGGTDERHHRAGPELGAHPGGPGASGTGPDRRREAGALRAVAGLGRGPVSGAQGGPAAGPEDVRERLGRARRRPRGA